MSEGFDSYATPVRTHEKSVLTNEEKIVSALDYNLEGDALVRWMSMKATGAPVESFVRWVDDFNATTAEERGKGKYDHSRTLDENVDIVEELKTGSGFPLIVTLHKNGEITFSTSLSQ
jgi:hypothetical protein